MIVFGSLTAAVEKKKPDFFMYTIMALFKKNLTKIK